MPNENPYRYEGTAESLSKSKDRPPGARPPSGMALFTAGVGGTIVAGLIVSLFYPKNYSPGHLILIAFEMPPILVFIASYKRKRNLLLAQLLFWFAASPLALCWYYFLLPFGKPGSVMARDFLTFIMVCYVSQLFAAAVMMGCMTSGVPPRRGFGSQSCIDQEISSRDKSSTDIQSDA